jgi:histone acetyltransferase (RNA polymerase elongator complex component)
LSEKNLGIHHKNC